MWFTFRCTELCPSSPVFACACFIISSHSPPPPHPFFFQLSTHHYILSFHSSPPTSTLLPIHHPRCWCPPPPTNRSQWWTMLLSDHALSQLHPTHHGPWAGCLGGVQRCTVTAGEAGTGLLWGRLDGWEQQSRSLIPSTGSERVVSVHQCPL